MSPVPMARGAAALRARRLKSGSQMRRVVVTGMGMVTPLGLRRRGHLAAPDRGRERRAQDRHVRRLRHPLQDRRHDPARRRHATAPTIPTSGWSRRSSARSTSSSSMRCARRSRRSTMPAGSPRRHDEQITTGVMIGSGIGGVEGIAETAITLHERGPRRVSPFFIPGRIINLASGYVSIEHGLKGPNSAVVTACSTGAHAIGDAGADDRARRCRRHGGGRHRIAGQPDFDGGLCRLRALSTGFNDTPTKASRPYDKDRDGFRHGRGRRRRRARGVRARQGARRQDLCRADRLRHVGRRLPHHGADRGRRRRVPLHERGDQARRHRAGRHRLHQRARHLDAARRRDRARRGAAPGRQCRRAASRCRRPSRRSAICSARPARSRRSSRSWRSATASRRRRSISTIHRSRRRSISCRIEARKRDIDVVLSNSFGFGGTNASLIFRRAA